MIVNILQSAHFRIKDFRDGSGFAASMPFCTFPVDPIPMTIVADVPMPFVYEQMISPA